MAQTLRQIIELQARDNTKKGVDSAKKQLTSFDRFIKRVHTTLLGFVGLHIATGVIRDFTRMSDEAVNLNNRLKLVTRGTAETEHVLSQLSITSQKTGSALSANAVLFTRMARPLRSLGFDLAEVVEVTDLFAQGLRISGASQQEVTSTIRQASQAMSSGVLRGEEFNAILENGGRLAIALADGMKVSIGELRAMSKQGELTAEVVTRAWLSQADVLEEENAKMVLTIAQSIENIKSKMTEFLSEHVESNRIISGFLQGVAANFDTVTKFAEILLVGAIAKLSKHLVTQIALRAKDAKAARAEHLIKKQAAENELKSQLQLSAVKARNAESDAANSLLKSEYALRGVKSSHAQIVALKAQATESVRLMTIERQRLATEVSRSRGTAAHTANIAKLNVVTNQLAATHASLNMLTTKTAASQALVADAITATTIAQERLTLSTKKSTIAQTINNAAFTAAPFSMFTTKLNKANIAGLGFFKNTGKGLKTLSKFIKPVISLVSKIGSALLGVWGIAGFVIYEMTKGFIDYGLVVRTTGLAIEKILAKIKLGLKAVSHPFNFVALKQDFNEYKAEIAKIESDWDKYTDKRIADNIAVSKGFVDAADMEKKAHSENVRSQINADSTLRKSQKERAEEFEELQKIKDKAIKDEIKSIEESEKAQLAALEASVNIKAMELAGEVDQQLQLQQLEQQAAETRQSIQLFALKERDEAWKKHFDALKANSDEYSRGYTAAIANETRQLKASAAERVAIHSKSIKEMSDQYKTLIESAVEYGNKSKEVLMEADEFVASVRRKNMSEQEKALVDEQAYREALSKARQADALDEVADFEKIKTLRTESQELLKTYIDQTQNRATTAKEGSLEELTAQQNVNAALAEYSSNAKALSQVYGANKTAFEDQAKIVKTRLKEQSDLVVEWNKTIDELDARLLLERTATVELDTKQAMSNLDNFDKAIDKTIAKIKRLNIKVNEYRNKNGNYNETQENFSKGGVAGKGTSVGLVDPSESRSRKTGKVGGYASGENDTVPAMLQRGEFVVRKYAVNALGEDFLRDLNNRPNKAMSNLKDSPNGIPAQFLSRGGSVIDPRERVNINEERGGFSLGAMIPYGNGSDSRTNKMIDGFRDQIENHHDDLRAVGKTPYYNGSNQWVKMAERLRELPSKYVRGGLGYLEDAWQITQGKMFLKPNVNAKAQGLGNKFNIYYKDAVARANKDARKDRKRSSFSETTSETSRSTTSETSRSTTSTITTPSRVTTTPPSTPSTPSVQEVEPTINTAKSSGAGAGLSYLARQIAPIQRAVDKTLDKANNITSGGGINSCKKVSIDLSIDDKTITGEFNDDEDTNSILNKLNYLQRVTIK